MESIPLSVTIPVGPKPHHKQWLGECLESIFNQTYLPKTIVVIDDMAHLDRRTRGNNSEHLIEFLRPFSQYTWHQQFTDGVCRLYPYDHLLPTVFYLKQKWLSGVTHSFNCGVAVADTEWVAMIGSDDMYYPTALEEAWDTIQRTSDPIGWYNFYCDVSDGSKTAWFNHAAVVSKSLWKKTGGFHPLSVMGGMDAILHSILMVHLPNHRYMIGNHSLYYVRDHANNYTKESVAKYPAFTVELRNNLTAEWKEPEWTRDV